MERDDEFSRGSKKIIASINRAVVPNILIVKGSLRSTSGNRSHGGGAIIETSHALKEVVHDHLHVSNDLYSLLIGPVILRSLVDLQNALALIQDTEETMV